MLRGIKQNSNSEGVQAAEDTAGVVHLGTISVVCNSLALPELQGVRPLQASGPQGTPLTVDVHRQVPKCAELLLDLLSRFHRVLLHVAIERGVG